MTDGSGLQERTHKDTGRDRKRRERRKRKKEEKTKKERARDRVGGKTTETPHAHISTKCTSEQ